MNLSSLVMKLKRLNSICSGSKLSGSIIAQNKNNQISEGKYRFSREVFKNDNDEPISNP
jgi:hypothetical protein